MDNPESKARSSVTKFLTPEVLRHTLLVAALYLAAFELLKASIVGRLRGFFSFGAEGEDGSDPNYAEQVSKLYPKDILRASCLWLETNGALTAAEVQEVQNIRAHRNEIAHELLKFVADVDANVSPIHLRRIGELLAKIETWWILEFEIPVNPHFDGKDVAPHDVSSGSMIAYQLMMSIALGHDDAQH